MTTQPTESTPYFRSVIPKNRVDEYTYNPEAIEPQPNAIFANRADAVLFLVTMEKQRLQSVEASLPTAPCSVWNTTELENGHILLEGLK